MWGHGGNYAMVLPNENMVLVFTAEPDTKGDSTAVSLPELMPLVRMILQAIVE
jgi:hypothetical protein